MAYPKERRGDQMYSGGSSYGDGYNKCDLDKSFKSHGGNVTGSRLNTGSDMYYRGKRGSYKHVKKGGSAKA